MMNSKNLTLVTVFTALSLLFGLVALWLISNNYLTDTAQYNWVLMRSILDADNLRLENLGFDQPHGQLLLLAPFYMIPHVQAFSPFVVSVTVTAAIFTLWYRQMAQGDYPLLQRIVLLLMMAVNPAIVWSATAGGGEALALLMFYLLYRSCLRMVYDNDIRSFIAIGLVLAAFLYFNIVSVYLFIALLPLLIMIVPIPQLRESPFSAYIIIGMPLLILVASWIYFNWIFIGDPLAFLHNHDSAFIGAKGSAETLPWLRDYGGHFVRPVIVGLAYVAIGYPVLLLLIWLSYKEGRQMKITLVLMLHPVISIGIATFTYFLASPIQITALITASIMAETGRMSCLKTRCFIPFVFLSILGTFTSWYIFVRDDYSNTQAWTAAFTDKQTVKHSGDIKVGRWLAINREPTLLDFQSGYRVIAERGDAVNLLLPFTHEYRIAMRSERPSVAQIAVPDPDGDSGRRDQINSRFPGLYDSGMTGYERVYDEDGWRVYRRMF